MLMTHQAAVVTNQARNTCCTEMLHTGVLRLSTAYLLNNKKAAKASYTQVMLTHQPHHQNLDPGRRHHHQLEPCNMQRSKQG